MKRITYKLLTLIPVVGGVVKAVVDPMPIAGSRQIESGYTEKVASLIKEYLKTHPDEQVTRQLIDRLLAEHRNKNNPQV